MTITEHKELAQAAAAWANVFGIMVGLSGAWIAIRKYFDDKRREIDQKRKDYNIKARDYYYKYCELSFAHPELRNGYLERGSLSRAQVARYQRFIMYMLNSIEDILDTEDDSRWEDALRSEVRLHSEFFQSSHFDEIADYFYASTRQWVAESLSRPNREPVYA